MLPEITPLDAALTLTQVPGAVVQLVNDVKAFRDADAAVRTLSDEKIAALEKNLGTGSIEESLAKANEDLIKRIGVLETQASRPELGGETATNAAHEIESRKQFVEFGEWCNKVADGENLDKHVMKAITIGDSASAGAIVKPPTFINQLIADIVEISPIRAHSMVVPMSTQTLTIGRKTGNSSAARTSEVEQIDESTNPTFGDITLTPTFIRAYLDYSMTSEMFSALSIESLLRGDLAEQFAKKEGSEFLTGSGKGAPEGILTNTNIGAVTNSDSATDISWESFATMLTTLKQPYWNDAVWLMNSTTLGEIWNTQDGESRPMLNPYGLEHQQPMTILGRPIVIAQDMPDSTTGLIPLVLANLKRGYIIGDAMDMVFQRDDVTQLRKATLRLYAFMMNDGRVRHPEAIVKLTMA